MTSENEGRSYDEETRRWPVEKLDRDIILTAYRIVCDTYDVSGSGTAEIDALVTLECDRILRILRKGSPAREIFRCRPVPAIIQSVEESPSGEFMCITYKALNMADDAPLERVWSPRLEDGYDNDIGHRIAQIAEENKGKVVSIMKTHVPFRNNPDRGMNIAYGISVE